MEGETSRKRKANWEEGEQEQEQENSLREEKQENITQEEIDKLSTSLLQNLKDDREKVTDYMSQWMKKSYEDQKKERIDTSFVDFLQLHVQLNTYFDALEDGYIQLDQSRGSLPLDQSTIEEIVNEGKLWEGLGDLCIGVIENYAVTLNSGVTPKTEAYYCKLIKIEGVIDKLCNDITLDHLVLVCILQNLDIIRERYNKDDASASTADCTEEMYEDLKKELVDLLKDNFWFDIADDLKILSDSAYSIASRLIHLLGWN